MLEFLGSRMADYGVFYPDVLLPETDDDSPENHRVGYI